MRERKITASYKGNEIKLLGWHMWMPDEDSNLD